MWFGRNGKHSNELNYATVWNSRRVDEVGKLTTSFAEAELNVVWWELVVGPKWKDCRWDSTQFIYKCYRGWIVLPDNLRLSTGDGHRMISSIASNLRNFNVGKITLHTHHTLEFARIAHATDHLIRHSSTMNPTFYLKSSLIPTFRTVLQLLSPPHDRILRKCISKRRKNVFPSFFHQEKMKQRRKHEAKDKYFFFPSEILERCRIYGKTELGNFSNALGFRPVQDNFAFIISLKFSFRNRER